MTVRCLNELTRGERGIVLGFRDPAESPVGSQNGALAQRLIEMGVDEGVDVELLQVGPFGRDPLCVRVGAIQLAIRRAEAAQVLVGIEAGGEPAI